MDKTTIYVVFRMTKEGGFPQEFMNAVHHSIEETRKQEGCIFYNLVKDHEIAGFPAPRKDTLTMIEEWRSHEDLQAHMKKPYLGTLIELLKKHEIKAVPEVFEKVK